MSLTRDLARLHSDSDGNLILANNLTVDTNTLTVDAANNRVGIGTSSPSNSLDVKTSAGKLSVEPLGSGSVRLASDGSMGLNVPSGYNYEIDVNGTEVMRINNEGKVGIGTSAPTNNLTIVDGGGSAYGADATILLDMKRNVTNSGAANSVGLRLANNSNGFSIKYGGASDTLNISGGSGNTMATFRNDGGVSLPYQPAFKAWGASIISAVGVMAFPNVTQRGGTNYNTANGLFTCPVAGWYSFTFHYLTHSTGTRNDTYFQKNGGVGVEQRNYKSSGNHVTHTLTQVDYFAANDTMGVRNVTGSIYAYDTWTRFTGFLLG